MTTTIDPRYPIGKFERRDKLSAADRRELIDQIAAAPQRLRDAVRGLNEQQLDTPYRDGGWTVRQVIHHLPDSHMNAYMRTKLALTETEPLIRPYDEDAWAKLNDSRDTPIETSMTLLEALHGRWVALLRSLDEPHYAQTLKHPEHLRIMSIDTLIGIYAWHGRHHVAHITSLRERMGF